MTDVTHSHQKLKRQSSRSIEYIVFFTLIFICAIPFAAVQWVIDLYRTKSLLINGPLARAWLEAHRITPVIFLA